MTHETLKEMVRVIDEVDAIGTTTFENCVARDLSLLIVGYSIEMHPDLTEAERDEARRHLLDIRGSYLDTIGGTTFD